MEPLIFDIDESSLNASLWEETSQLYGHLSFCWYMASSNGGAITKTCLRDKPPVDYKKMNDGAASESSEDHIYQQDIGWRGRNIWHLSVRFGSSEFDGVASLGSRNSSAGDVYQEGKITVERGFDSKGKTAEVGEGDQAP